MPSDAEKRLDEQVKKFKEGQIELSKTQDSIQRLMTQKNETESVLTELNLLETDAEVFKKTGNMLVKVEQTDAKQNVKDRLKFISDEILETKLKDLEVNMDGVKVEIGTLQQQISAAPK